jgi:4-amino-4-deoxy-L-arabinose transferase-like glycosyltransferase
VGSTGKDVLMTYPGAGDSLWADRWRWRLLAAALILGAAALHVAYLAWSCPLDLAPDEAHYWDWSRHLDWSYYSKGPLVALLIRAGTALAGPWSRQLTTTDMLAVRLPAVLCGSLLAVSLYVLTAQVYRRESWAAAVVALALTLPPFAAGASLMTIDSPYTCCWGWALVLGFQAVFRGSRWAWPTAGLVAGLGILAKYTMVLWVPSLGLFLLTSPGWRRLLFRPGFWVMTAMAAACCLPILWWNAQRDWAGFRHVNALAGLQHEAAVVHWAGPLVYVGGQALLLLGYWFVAWAAAMIVHRPWREPEPALRYLWWLSAPMFAVFLLFSPKTGGGEVNWPVTAYLSGLVLAVGWLPGQLRHPRPWQRRVAWGCLTSACGLGLVVTVLMHHTEWLHPLLARLAGPPTSAQVMPLRRFDPTCRLRGWRVLAAAVDQLRAELRRQGTEPVLAGSAWTLPGELGFYCQGHPTVHSLGLAQGDRHSQYDWWHPNPVADAEAFKGRTFILVGDVGREVREAFVAIDPAQTVTYSQRGQPLSMWAVSVCRGFRGFRTPTPARGKPDF